MLDIGWTELVVIAIVMIVVVGPKDLPPMLRAFGKMMTKFRGMASDFRHQFDEALKEADLDDVRKTLSDAQKLNPAHSLREAMNPLRQMGNDIKADLQKATAPQDKPKTETASSVPPASEIVADSVLPVHQPANAPVPAPVPPVVDPVAAAAVASAEKQLVRAAANEKSAVDPIPAKARKDGGSDGAKDAGAPLKKPKSAVKKAVGAEAAKPAPRKTDAKTKKKGDA